MSTSIRSTCCAGGSASLIFPSSVSTGIGNLCVGQHVTGVTFMLRTLCVWLGSSNCTLTLGNVSFRRSELPKLAKETVPCSICLHWSFSQSDLDMNDRDALVLNEMRAMQLSVPLSLCAIITAICYDAWVAGDTSATATPIKLCDNGVASGLSNVVLALALSTFSG